MTDRQVAVWQCPHCGAVRTLVLPSYYTIRRECEHWRPDAVYIYVMRPLNDLAKAVDEHESEIEKESAARTLRERMITEERADYRFGFV
jgi:hypothetical protein